MSHDQCPSTVKGEKQRPGKDALAGTPRTLQRVNGRAAWRSIDELIDTPEFREHLEREFPSGMSELVTRERLDLSATGSKDGESRREFLKLMGASVALAGAATIPGCRRPDHKIYSYSKVVPEEVIPGKALYYTTSMPRWDGGAEGLLVETHEGRPTKIEGNPLHPYNQGKASSWSIASIMSLYDPDRPHDPVYRNPVRGEVPASWDDFRAWGADHFKAFDATQGEGLAFLVEKNDSPTRAHVRDKIRKRWPKAMWVPYAPAEATGWIDGTRLAFGKPMREMLNLTRDKTKVIVSLDRDFLHREAGELAAARQFASTRTLVEASDPMSRLYVIESGHSITGMQADHRLRLAPSRVTAFAVELAKFILPKLGDPASKSLGEALAGVKIGAGEDIDRAFLEECAKDLLDPAHRGGSVILAGPSQPMIVHAIVAALNQALENVGKGVSYVAVSEEWAASSDQGLRGLATEIDTGRVKTLVCVNTNPAYDAPGDVDFASLMKKPGLTSVTLSVGASETMALSTWALNGAHYLESWGDTRALDGTIAPIQPMIAPLYETAMSEIEFLALLAGKDFSAKVDGYELLRECWQSTLSSMISRSSVSFNTFLRRCLHNGVVAGSAVAPESPKVNMSEVARSASSMMLGGPPTSAKLEVVFTTGNLADGRFANVGWMQELPDVCTRVVWDNPVLLSPRTAKELGLLPLGYSDVDNESRNDMYTKPKYPTGRVALVKLGDRSVRSPVWIMPGMADNTAVLTLGYGRTRCGVVGDGVGTNFHPLRTRDLIPGGGRASIELRLEPTGDTQTIASTQNHWTLDSKTTILRAIDLPAWRKHAGDVKKVVNKFYGTSATINLAEQLGELSHTPPNLSVRTNPYNRSNADPDPKAIVAGDPNGPAYQRSTPPEFLRGPQWGMTIDQTLCTGCGACMIACQAENNIPVVGKKETAKGREMHWIRVDRYFTGDDLNNPGQVHHQPVACVHCENAPCEVVCPVNATVHGPEGLNYMTYNRCIGTRYCANNCPYKVRRYNWFDYGVTKFNGGYYGKELLDDLGGAIPGQEGVNGSRIHNKINPNFIPPRLRQKLDEISKMQKNPDVTVRSRGVMEKCTYCVQRINAAKIDAKLADLKDKNGKHVIPDGFFQSACQQACPSNAIVFGDILDPSSKVHATRRNARSYALLGYLNTRPRTSHMLRVMNPNPALLARIDPERAAHIDDPFHHVGGHHGDHGGGHGEHGKGHGAPSHSFHRSTHRSREDRGYALSLNVLGGRA